MASSSSKDCCWAMYGHLEGFVHHLWRRGSFNHCAGIQHHHSGFFFFGLSLLTSLQFIQYRVAGFYKPTIPQNPPSHLRGYSTCNNARLEFSIIFVPSFDPNEWCLKNGLHSGGLKKGPVGHESSALTTRPRLFTYL